MALGAAALITTAGLTACGDDEGTGPAATDPGSGASGSAALEEASTLISENSDLICTGPAAFEGYDAETLSCVWDYNEGMPPEDALSEVMLWSDEDTPDQEAALEASHNRPGGLGTGGVEMDWSLFEASADTGGYVEMQAYTGWDNLQEARDAIREKLDIPCTNLNAPTGEAAKCGAGVLAFDLSVDDLEVEAA